MNTNENRESDDAVEGVDYDPGCCDVCAGADPTEDHSHREEWDDFISWLDRRERSL